MKTALLAILAIFSVAIIPAYAAEVQFPTLTTDGMVDYDLKTFYPTNSTYIVQISILYDVPHPIEIPDRITWFEIDGTPHFVSLQDDMRMIHFPADEEKQIISPSSALSESDIQRILAEKRKELSQEDNSGFSKLRACLVEFEELHPVRFAAWERIASLSEFTIPDQWLNQDHYSRAELEAQKKWVICEALKKYQYLGAWTANKIIDVHVDKPQDTTDSPHTVPVTAEAIREAEYKAQVFACSLEGQRQGLCKDYMVGEKYVVPEPKLPDWYAQYREQNEQSVDLQTALDVAMLTQCENYYSLYQANSAIQLPSWLSHCEEQ